MLWLYSVVGAVILTPLMAHATLMLLVVAMATVPVVGLAACTLKVRLAGEETFPALSLAVTVMAMLPVVVGVYEIWHTVELEMFQAHE